MCFQNENVQAKPNKSSSEINFSVAFKKDGESFQSIMEKILINKITKNINESWYLGKNTL